MGEIGPAAVARRCSETLCQANAVGWPEYWVNSENRCWAHLEAAEADFKKGLQTAEGTIAGGQFERVDLSGVRLDKLVFVDCAFNEARFRDAILKGVTFRNCEAKGADFRNAVLDEVRIENRILDEGETGLSWNRATFAFARIRDMTATGGAFHQANFYGAATARLTFENTQLHEADLSHADLGDLVLRNCQGPGATFADSHFHNLIIRGAPKGPPSDFSRANFRGVVLRFSGEASSAPFTRASLREAHFDAIAAVSDDKRVCTGDRVLFDACELRGASLRRAVLRDWKMRGPKVGKQSNWDGVSFSDATLEGCKFERLSLIASAFDGADVVGASAADRKKCPGQARVHFSQCVMNAANMSRVTLRHADFIECKAISLLIDQADLEDVTWDQMSAFQSANFNYSSLTDVRFGVAAALKVDFDSGPRLKLNDALFTGANFVRANFRGVGVERADFTRAQFGKNCNLTALLADGADFTGANLSHGFKLDGGRFAKAIFDQADLSGCSCAKAAEFDDATFREAVLVGFEATGSCFKGAVLSDASLLSARFVKCDFKGANLSGVRGGTEAAGGDSATFDECKFQGADLSQSILRGVRFRRTCEFPGAKLEGADAQGANFDKADFSAANLTGILAGKARPGDVPASFGRANFDGASLGGSSNLIGCHFRGASFTHAILDGADLKGACLADTTFEGASLRGVINLFKCARTMNGELDFGATPANFNYATIDATEAPEFGTPEWFAFKTWLGARKTKSAPKEDAMRRELNWVAWKNNYASLGLNDEQGECYRQERLQVCGPPPRWIEVLLGQDRPRWRRWALELGSRLLLVSLLVAGLVSVLSALGYVFARPLYEDVPAYLTGPGLLLAIALIPLGWIVVKSGEVRARFWDGLFGFGEKPSMILLNAGVVIAVFAGAYGLLNHYSDLLHLGQVEMNNGPKVWTEYLYFSTVTFTTLGHFNYKAFLIFPALIALEGAIGLIFAALLIQTLARRIGGR